MDLLDRLLAHDVWTTRRLLELCRDLGDDTLDREFDVGHRSLRATFDHVVHNVEVWSALMTGEPIEPEADRSVDGLLARLDVASRRLARVARDVRDRRAWDERWVDHLDDPPREKPYGTAIAHVLTHSMHHRDQLLYLMRLSGARDLPEGDVFSWERATRPVVDLVTRFARALDGEDYPTVRRLLHDDCEYVCRGETHRGPEAIVESYRSNGDAGRSEFESIVYESTVRGVDERTAVVRFVDHLERAGERFTFESEQVVDAEGDRIVRIEHVDLPGRCEALEAFRNRTNR